LHCSDKWHNWLYVLKFEWSDVLVPGSCLVGGLKTRILLGGLAPLLFMLSPLVLSIVLYMFANCRAQITKLADDTQWEVGIARDVAAGLDGTVVPLGRQQRSFVRRRPGHNHHRARPPP
jgi:hypothetical protein